MLDSLRLPMGWEGEAPSDLQLESSRGRSSVDQYTSLGLYLIYSECECLSSLAPENPRRVHLKTLALFRMFPREQAICGDRLCLIPLF